MWRTNYPTEAPWESSKKEEKPKPALEFNNKEDCPWIDDVPDYFDLAEEIGEAIDDVWNVTRTVPTEVALEIAPRVPPKITHEKERLLRERNRAYKATLICRKRQAARWPTKYVTLDLKKLTIKKSRKRESKADRFNISKLARKCFYGAENEVLNPIKHLSEERFNYYEFQQGLKLGQDEEESRYLLENLDKLKPACYSLPTDKKDILKHLQRMYGPLDKEHELTNELMKQYMHGRVEWVQLLIHKLKLYRDAAKVHGADVIRKLLQGNLEEVLRKKAALGGNPVKREIYDVNPYTNPTHSEWFLLPRPPKPHPSNLCVSVPIFEKFVEYQVPARLKGQYMLIKGYWPNLTDYNLIYANTTPLPLDLLTFVSKTWGRNPDGLESKFLKRDVREHMWDNFCLYLRQYLESHPTGVDLHTTVEQARKLGRFLEQVNFFPKLPREQAITHFLGDFILNTTIDNPSGQGNSIFILYPPYLRGVVRDRNDTCEFLRKIYCRIRYLDRANGGGAISNVPRENLFCEIFKTEMKINSMGFKNEEQFLRWCDAQWPDKDLPGNSAPPPTSSGSCSQLSNDEGTFSYTKSWVLKYFSR